MRRPLLVVLLALALLLSVRRARAVEGVCRPPATAWAARCSAQSGLSVRALHCPPGRVVAGLFQGEQHVLDVEIGAAREKAFHHVGTYSVAPIGDFPDWNKVPPGRRQALAALETCLQRDPSLPVRWVGTPRVHDEAPKAPPHVPWLLCAGLVVALALCRPRRLRWRPLAGLALLSLACFAFRRVAFPQTFFHQNGHGPEWVLSALVRGPDALSYGPGYGQLFGAIAAAARWPDRAIFLAQAVAAALQPALAWIIARRSGAPRNVAGAIAFGFAIDPALGRTAQSESYFATGTTLALVATAILVVGARRGRVRSPRFALGVLAAGLVVAQAACVHPLLWMPLATVPLALLGGRGRLSARLAVTMLAALGIGAVVALAAGPTMARVLGGAVGRTGSPFVARMLPQLVGKSPVLLLAVGLRFVPRPLRRRLVPLVALIFTLALASIAAVFLNPNPAVSAAWARVFWPALAALLAGSVTQLLPLAKRRLAVRPGQITRGAALGVGALAAVWSVTDWAAITRLPTDVREQTFAMQWREHLPPHAVVAYLARVGDAIVTLPLYPTAKDRPRGEALWSDQPVPAPGGAGPRYYYRSSLCSTDGGASFCDKFEHQTHLGRVEALDLPAIPSMRWNRYSAAPVHVELSRVLGW